MSTHGLLEKRKVITNACGNPEECQNPSQPRLNSGLTDLCSVDNTIPGAFDYRQKILIGRTGRK
jgi:hypothetical protein